MTNQWFRLYSEILNDPKVQIVTEALRWRYVALLCLHCNGNYENAPNDEIALSLRVTVEEWEFTRQEFIKRKLLSQDGKINGWEKRQYISDIKDSTAAIRQKRYRDNKRNARNATVTSRLPDSDTDTDTEKKISKYKGSRFTLPTPPDEWIEFCSKNRPDLDPGGTFESFKDYWIARPGKDGIKTDWLATWRNWVRNQKKGKQNGQPNSNYKPGKGDQARSFADKALNEMEESGFFGQTGT